MGRINYHLLTLMDSLPATESSSTLRHCKTEECPHYGLQHGNGSKYVCKRQAHNPRSVQKGQECLDELLKK